MFDFPPINLWSSHYNPHVTSHNVKLLLCLDPLNFICVFLLWKIYNAIMTPFLMTGCVNASWTVSGHNRKAFHTICHISVEGDSALSSINFQLHFKWCGSCLEGTQFNTLCKSIIYLIYQKKLQADRPHPRKYPHTPTDYRQTAVRVSADGRTDRQTLPSTLSPSDHYPESCKFR